MEDLQLQLRDLALLLVFCQENSLAKAFPIQESRLGLGSKVQGGGIAFCSLRNARLLCLCSAF